MINSYTNAVISFRTSKYYTPYSVWLLTLSNIKDKLCHYLRLCLRIDRTWSECVGWISALVTCGWWRCSTGTLILPLCDGMPPVSYPPTISMKPVFWLGTSILFLFLTLLSFSFFPSSSSFHLITLRLITLPRKLYRPMQPLLLYRVFSILL